MIHTLELGVPDDAALDFWAERLAAARTLASRARRTVSLFADPDGLALELVLASAGQRRTSRHASGDTRRARDRRARGRARLLRVRRPDRAAADRHARLHRPRRWRVPPRRRAAPFAWTLEPAPDTHGRLGAGTVHHIAWASTRRGPSRLAGARPRRRRARHRRARPRLLPLDLLPRAGGSPVRDRHPLPRLRRRRGPGPPRRGAAAAEDARAPARPARAHAHAGGQPAGRPPPGRDR